MHEIPIYGCVYMLFWHMHIKIFKAIIHFITFKMIKTTWQMGKTSDYKQRIIEKYEKF